MLQTRQQKKNFPINLLHKKKIYPFLSREHEHYIRKINFYSQGSFNTEHIFMKQFSRPAQLSQKADLFSTTEKVIEHKPKEHRFSEFWFHILLIL